MPKCLQFDSFRPASRTQILPVVGPGQVLFGSRPVSDRLEKNVTHFVSLHSHEARHELHSQASLALRSCVGPATRIENRESIREHLCGNRLKPTVGSPTNCRVPYQLSAPTNCRVPQLSGRKGPLQMYQIYQRRTWHNGLESRHPLPVPRKELLLSTRPSFRTASRLQRFPRTLRWSRRSGSTSRFIPHAPSGASARPHPRSRCPGGH